MQPILVIRQAKDGKPGLLNRAVQLSEKSKLKIHVLDAVYSEGLDSVDELSETQRKKYQKQLIKDREQEIAEELAKVGLTKGRATITVVWQKDILTSVLDYCKKIDPALVLKQAHSHKRKIMRTPLDWHLIERCQQPLLITPANKRKKKPTILVALDLATKVKTKASLNPRLMEAASRYVAALGGDIHIVCCANLSPVLADLDIIDSRALRKKMQARVAPQLAALREEYGIDDSKVVVKVGQPARVIASTATKLKADMVVLGSAGRRGVKGRLLGNTAEQLISSLNTDLLLLRG